MSENGSNEVSEEKNERQYMLWIKKHKGELIFLGVGFLAGIIGVKNKDPMQRVWKSFQAKIEKSKLYSNKWLKEASDTELNAERERIRLAFCSSSNDFSKACRLESLLARFDDELRNRAWGNEIPHPPRLQREHGWYLPNDD